MARLFSVSCGSLPVLLLLLASAPVMASWESAVEVLGEHLLEWAEKKTTPDAMREYFLGRAEKLTPHALREMNAPEDFIKGVKWGFKTCKILKKLQRLIEKPNPGGGTTTYAAAAVVIPTGLMANITAKDHGLCGPKVAVGLQRLGPGPRVSSSWAVVGFGNGGQLSKTFPKFSYQVASDGRAVVWLPSTAAPPPQGRHTIPLHTNPKYPRDGRYCVEVAGILVGDKVVRTSTKLGFRRNGTGEAYLSITEPYTYLERGVYLRLEETLMSQIKRLNPGAVPTRSSGKLCYARTELTMVPSMAILFAGDAVMKLGAATKLWYREGPDSVCLAILPTNLSSPGKASVLGRWLQTGRAMTVDVTPGTPATLTF
ncbi:hypothetical protein HU200_019563 [Digitaria exilis]|uniref:Xylanase inhibitor C-terminal domain-containing protein n=1 Tax=Digitaria exilis TaxID=1010633 RepID=A0A835KH31_9POAL|nr:hypothetical protein HU200_019563 [Digitaria exilis]